MKRAIDSTIDRAGRVVIPREVRREAGLEPGTSVRIRARNGTIEIEPAPREAKIEKRGRLRVAIPLTEGEALDRETVERARAEIRSGRGRRT